MADSERILRQLAEEFGSVCKRRKLRVNESKSKVMQCTRLVDSRRMNVALNGEVLEKADCFRYLGFHVALDGRIEGGVKFRMNKKKVVRGSSGTNCAIWG